MGFLQLRRVFLTDLNSRMGCVWVLFFTLGLIGTPRSQEGFEPTQVNWNAVTLPARCDLAKSLLDQGEYAAASHELEVALAQGGDPFSLHAMLSTTYLLERDIPRAKAHLQKAHEISPKNPDLLALEGQFELALGDRRRGESLLEELVAMQPGILEAHLILARSYLQREEPKLAKTHLDALKDLAGGSLATLVKVMDARRLGLQGLYPEALREAGEAYAEEPSMPEAIREWGLALVHSERYTEAKVLLERTWNSGPRDTPLAYALGEMHFRSRDWVAAQKYWEAGNHMNPLAYPVAQKLVGLYLATGQISKGQALVEKLRQEYPNRVESLLLETFWARKLGHFAQARHLLTRLERIPLSHDVTADIRWESAQLEFESGRHHNCQKLLTGLVKDGAWQKEAALLSARIAYYQNRVAEGERLQSLAQTLPMQWPKAGTLIAGSEFRRPVLSASRASR